MKKILMICAAGLAVLAAVSCCKNANKVTAIVAGPEQDVIALQIAYEAPVCPESVCPEAFEVEGREVVCAKACPKSGAVTLILKGDCPKAECGEKHECDKPCGEPKPECCEAKKPCCPEDCCGEAKPCKDGKECCDKPECCKKGDKPCCKEGKPECSEKHECGEKPECKKECKEIAVPKIAVKQVADLKDIEGNVIPAWKKAVKASEVKPAHPKHHHGPACGHKHDCKGEKPACDKPCDKPCGE